MFSFLIQENPLQQVFKLPFDIPKSNWKIGLKDPILLNGSCFSDEIGTKFAQYKFDVLSNPFGTVYNPISLFKALAGKIKSDRLLESQGVVYHWDCHGEISGLMEREVKQNVQLAINQTTEFAVKARVIILTLGSAFVYRLKESGEVVANCHKVQANQFSKELLSVDEILGSFDQAFTSLKTANEQLKIIFNVSPVRHIKDGLVENNRSKAILFQAVHQLVNTHESISYFPSYEILIDELRDYRFYTKDRVHPSGEAVEYIWGRFCTTYFDQETQIFLKDWEKLMNAVNHRPFQPKSRGHQNFLKETLKSLENLKSKVNVTQEINQLKSQLL